VSHQTIPIQIGHLAEVPHFQTGPFGTDYWSSGMLLCHRCGVGCRIPSPSEARSLSHLIWDAKSYPSVEMILWSQQFGLNLSNSWLSVFFSTKSSSGFALELLPGLHVFTSTKLFTEFLSRSTKQCQAEDIYDISVNSWLTVTRLNWAGSFRITCDVATCCVVESIGIICLSCEYSKTSFDDPKSWIYITST